MTKPSAKITVPEVIDKFKSYNAKHGAWGNLHIVLEDQNLGDDSVKACIRFAEYSDDKEGKELAEFLLTLSQTQRLRIAQLA
jgi:hypothetical protein